MSSPLRLAAVAVTEPTPKLYLVADADALNALIAALREPNAGWSADLVEPPAAAELALSRLTVRRAPGPVEVLAVNDELVVSGCAADLFDFADYLFGYALASDLDRPGTHTHVDRDGLHPPRWLAESSTPLEVTGWVLDRH